MKLLDLTLDSPAENLALDEALLEQAEADGPQEVLRLWEPESPLVVMGRSSKVATEVEQERCAAQSIPYLRRCSGGAAIVTGPGCLMYAVVLSYELRPALRVLDQAHHFVLTQMATALRALDLPVEQKGTSDLVIGETKFSGNSLRCKRNHLLYHGTLLYDFPLELIGECLGTPPRQPEYRRGRTHDRFVANLQTTGVALRNALIAQWQATVPLEDWPKDLTAEFAEQRYRQDAWNLRW
ncbi:MAG TPA: lipoate--protein ligase family protein [Planctomycetaceae bacterium]|nr:lipoate-protein ligase A related protein [Blastopirellula sp.]HAY81187.1 lipoate--protein ligase family protein [Planctomycetaceae bacterium]